MIASLKAWAQRNPVVGGATMGAIIGFAVARGYYWGHRRSDRSKRSERVGAAIGAVSGAISGALNAAKE